MSSEQQSKIRVVPARSGFAWLVQSMALMRAQAGRLFLLVVLLQFIMGLSQVPLIGFLLIISVPALSAGLLQAFHVTSGGGRPSLGLLFLPLVSCTHTRRLLVRGGLMFAVGVLTVAMLLPASDTLLDPDLLSRIEQGDLEALTSIDPDILNRMVLAFLTGIAISGTLSYMTIPLLWFQDCKLGSALSDGLRAMFVNWKPFLVLGLGMAVLLVPVSLVAAMLYGLAGSAGAYSVLVMALIMVLVLAFQLMLFGTQYCAFRDIFGVKTTQQEVAPAGDDQLVA